MKVVLIAMLGLFNSDPTATSYESLEACNDQLDVIALNAFKDRKQVTFGTNELTVDNFDNYYCIEVKS